MGALDLEVTIYDEDRDKKVEFLGKVAIPLLRVRLFFLWIFDLIYCD
jgi:hypothetical protein